MMSCPASGFNLLLYKKKHNIYLHGIQENAFVENGWGHSALFDKYKKISIFNYMFNLAFMINISKMPNITK